MAIPASYLKAAQNVNFMKPEIKKCSEQEKCQAPSESGTDEKCQAPSESGTVKTAETKLDPTHFGDWQINGRAIDF